jgi:FBP C-terminal treble-clef zinc-finger
MFDDAALQDAIDRSDLTPAEAAGLRLAIEGEFEDYLVVSARKGRRAFLFAPYEGDLRMIELRPPVSSAAPRRAVMCSLCLTVLPGSEIGMWTNQPTGKRHNVAGDWICRGFECKDRVAGRLDAPKRMQLNETVPAEWRRQRMRARLERLVERWLVRDDQ